MLFHSIKKPTELSIINLNRKQTHFKKRLALAHANADDKKGLCKLVDALKKKKDEENHQDDNKKTIYVIDFVGDMRASAVECLREEISAILSVTDQETEVIVRLESAGGQVHGYGLAAAELERIKKAGLSLTICVDKVAASGGYMMACVADKIIATPFAIVGSIGVVSQMPNFYEFLKKHDIAVEQFTAGEYKRTVTMFGKNDDDDRAKYQEDLNRIHELFKNHISQYRPNLDIEKLATGEIWFGQDALGLGLVDELGTSDDYIMAKMTDNTVLLLHSHQKPTVAEKLGLAQVGTAVLAGVAQIAKNNLPALNKLSSHVSL